MFTCSTRMSVKTVATLAAAIIGIGGSTTLHAQDVAHQDTEERLLACDGITDPTEKLACFDTVVETLKPPPVAPVAETPSATVPASDASAAVVSPVSAAAESPALASDPVVSEPAQVDAASSSTGTPSAPAETTAQAVNDFGFRESRGGIAEQQEDDKLESIHAKIVRVWATTGRHFAVELDNGQVWRETERARARMPRKGLSVEISKESLGSYRMKYENSNRFAWMRREK